MNFNISLFAVGLLLFARNCARGCETVSKTEGSVFRPVRNPCMEINHQAIYAASVLPRQTFVKTLRNSKELSWLHILIIGMGNDININPGPSSTPFTSCTQSDDPPAPCAICGDEVGHHPVKGIQCDACEKWNHASCINMGSKTYYFLANTSISWICDGCGQPNYSRSSPFCDTILIESNNPFSLLVCDQSLSDEQPLGSP